eukprot:CAMPEP_0205823438 /NCGR_PEP_ID=MMETSP0206-20130828/16548_1 /ASSEMBLY_ACC=CAM_ASM_000279 /TAXON_ID=36767 /ORGANISM="Euplotes focardii, Strain TN1" /LENGTH=73 /DNA_ID=CAMNT_0053120607 /DNA_START=428 /DNA_END=646 /DNA_ORIENTATION=-
MKEHGLKAETDPFENLALLESTLGDLEDNQKMFFVGETNQGFPIIYTQTIDETKINLPQKYKIYIENSIICNG